MADKPVFGKCDTENKIGKRDAFHVPAILVYCIDSFAPGEKVWIDNASFAYRDADMPHNAIIDPMLKDRAFIGSRVWAMILPEFVGEVSHHFVIKGVDDKVAKPEIDFAAVARNPESIPTPHFDEYESCRGCW